MSGWDVGSVYLSSSSGVTSAVGRITKTDSQIIAKFGDFIRNFTDKNSYIYRYDRMLIVIVTGIKRPTSSKLSYEEVLFRDLFGGSLWS
jgi:hypothetical protein